MNILVPIMNGFEEIELVSIVDILRRANINVILAKDSNNNDELITGAHNIYIKAECKICEVDIKNLDSIVLAGGHQGMLNLKNSKEVIDILQKLNKQNKLIAAICASPVVLSEAGILKNNFTCYPGYENNIKAQYTKEPICIDENIITANGPANAIAFGFEIIKKLLGEAKCNKTKESMIAV